MKSITSAQMRELDRLATEKYGIPSLTLMENAGKGIADLILKHFYTSIKILIFCGKGNNGGDGFVIARYLHQHREAVRIVLLTSPDEIKRDAWHNFDRIDGVIPILSLKDVLSDSETSYDLVVDAIFGFGLKSEVTGNYREAIEWINRSGKPVVAVDIPSGLDADEGQVMGTAVKATLTATLACPKTGLLKGSGPACTGQLHIIDIGFPAALLPPA